MTLCPRNEGGCCEHPGEGWGLCCKHPLHGHKDSPSWKDETFNVGLSDATVDKFLKETDRTRTEKEKVAKVRNIKEREG